MITEKNKEKLGWVLFCIFVMATMLTGMELLADLTYYLLNK